MEHIDVYPWQDGWGEPKSLNPGTVARAATNELPFWNGHNWFTAVHEEGDCEQHHPSHAQMVEL